MIVSFSRGRTEQTLRQQYLFNAVSKIHRQYLSTSSQATRRRTISGLYVEAGQMNNNHRPTSTIVVLLSEITGVSRELNTEDRNTIALGSFSIRTVVAIATLRRSQYHYSFHSGLIVPGRQNKDSLTAASKFPYVRGDVRFPPPFSEDGLSLSLQGYAGTQAPSRPLHLPHVPVRDRSYTDRWTDCGIVEVGDMTGHFVTGVELSC